MVQSAESSEPTSERALHIDWDGCDRRRWDDYLSGAGPSALEQSWAYGEAVAAMPGYRVRRAVIRHDETPLALVQTFRRTIGALGALERITRGPLLLEGARALPWRRAVLRLIHGSFRIRRRELLLWMPELSDSAGNVALMRACGARRVVTGYSTIRIDLSPDVETLRAGLRGKWRNHLRAAERARLRIDESHGGPKLDWLLANYEAFRRRARFVGPPPALIRAFAENANRRRDVMMLRAIAGRDPVAGVLFLRHGATATYFVGWTGAEGRRRSAHNLLLWRAMTELKDRGVAWLDLGGVDAHSASGVARFKVGMGGELLTLTGTYI